MIALRRSFPLVNTATPLVAARRTFFWSKETQVRSVANAASLDVKDDVMDTDYFENVSLYSRLLSSFYNGLSRVEQLSEKLDKAFGALPEFSAMDHQNLPPQMLLMQIRMENEEKKNKQSDKAH
eukprot:EG_transcript_19206